MEGFGKWISNDLSNLKSIQLDKKIIRNDGVDFKSIHKSFKSKQI